MPTIKSHFMQKLFLSLSILTCFFALHLPNSANAQFVVAETPTAETGSESAIKTISTFNQVYSIISFFLALLFLISIIGLVVAAIKFFIAGGSEKVLEEARSILLYSMAAFALSILGYIMINLFRYVII